MQPGIMLLDEVTSALDPELVAEVLGVIRELAAAGMTMLIATHEMGFARDIADRVCFLDEGVILEQGPPKQVFTAPVNTRTQQFLRRIVDAGPALRPPAGWPAPRREQSRVQEKSGSRERSPPVPRAAIGCEKRDPWPNRQCSFCRRGELPALFDALGEGLDSERRGRAHKRCGSS